MAQFYDPNKLTEQVRDLLQAAGLHPHTGDSDRQLVAEGASKLLRGIPPRSQAKVRHKRPGILPAAIMADPGSARWLAVGQAAHARVGERAPATRAP